MRLSGVGGRSLLAGAMVLLATLEVCAAPYRLGIPDRTRLDEDGEGPSRIEQTLEYLEGLIRSLSSEKSRSAKFARLGEVWGMLDQARAREHFRESVAELRRMEAELSPDAAGRAESLEEMETLRRSILRRAAAVDPELARILIEEERDRILRAHALDPEMQSAWQGQDAALIDYAEILMESDPEKAASLAIDSLKNGLPEDLSSFLTNLWESNPEGANSVFEAALQQTLESGRPELDALMALLDYVFQGAETDGWTNAQPASGIDAATTARLLNALGAALSSFPDSLQGNTAASNELTLGPEDRRDFIQDHMNLFMRYAPDQVAALESAVQRLAAGMGPGLEPKGLNPGSPALRGRNGSDPGTRTRAANSPSVSDQSLIQAALQASREGDWSRAQQLTDRVRKAESRGQAKELVALEFAMSAVRGDDFERVRHFASSLSEPTHRAEVFAATAERLIQQSRKDEALGWMEDAVAEGSRSTAAPGKARILLSLLQMSAGLSVSKAFEVAQTVVLTLNRDDAPSEQARRSSGKNTEPAGIASKRTLDGQTIERVSETALLENLEAAFERLGQLHFDDAILMVSQLRSTDRKIVAELAVCRGALSNHARKHKTSAP
ncbi:MAG: hypothetical protein HY650_13005 [Acidobacteria bacterium]|nr:hypothetical protein [Acidobacteriota bacterium]